MLDTLRSRRLDGRRWTTRGAARLDLPNAQPREKHFDGRFVHDPKTRAWLHKFLDLWIGLGK